MEMSLRWSGSVYVIGELGGSGVHGITHVANKVPRVFKFAFKREITRRFTLDSFVNGEGELLMSQAGFRHDVAEK